MSQQFSYLLERGEEEIELLIEAECTYEGAPERGPSYSSGGEPAEDPEFSFEAYLGKEPAVLTLAEEEAIYDFVAENWCWEEDQ